MADWKQDLQGLKGGTAVAEPNWQEDLATIKEPMFRTTPQPALRNDPNDIFINQPAPRPKARKPEQSVNIYGAFDVWAAPSDSEIWKSPGADFVRGFGQGWMRQTQVPALMGKKLPPPTTRAERIGEGAGQAMEVITEFIGLGALLRSVGLMSKVIPKSAWATRALQTGFLFGTQQATEEARKATAEAVYGEDFGSRGGIAILESFALGAILSIASSGVGKVWNRLKPSEQKMLLRELGLKKGATLREIDKAAKQVAAKSHFDFGREGMNPAQIRAIENKFKQSWKRMTYIRDRLKILKSGDIIKASSKQNFKKQLMGKTGVSSEVADVAIQRLDAGESITKVDQMISQAKVGIKPLVTAPPKDIVIPPTKAIAAPEKPVVGQALVKAPMGYIKAIKNAKGKYEIKMGREAPDNPFTNEIFTGEFDTPQIARKSYEAWFMKQQKPVAVRKAEIAPVTQPKVEVTPLTRKEATFINNELPKHIRLKRKEAGTLLKAGDRPNPIAELKLINAGFRKAPKVEKIVKKEYRPDMDAMEKRLAAKGIKLREIVVAKPVAPITPEKAALPPHLQKIADKAKEIDRKRDFVIEDVTPKGFGPSEAGEPVPSKQLTIEQNKLISTINEAKTILKGDISGDKRASIERNLAKAEKKLEVLAKPKAVVTKPKPVKPGMATQAQKAQAHIIAKKKAFVSEKGKMRPGYRALAKALTGQTSVAKMTEQQAADFINSLSKLPEPRMKGGRLIPPTIPRTTKLVPKGFFQRQFKRPTPVGLITSNAYYAEKLGVKSLVEPLERAKMRFDLEHHSASNEIDKMGQKIDVLGKTTAKEKITAKVRNIPTKARAEMGDLLDSYEEVPTNLDPKKKEIFDWFRNLTRTMLARQNEARAKLEMPLIKGRKAYMRHIATDISREMLAGKYPFPEGIGFWSGLNTGKKIFNPMEFQRKLEEDIYGLFTRDPVYASKAMMYNALKEIHLNQPLKFFNEQLSALGKDLPEYKNLSPRERVELDKTSVMPADTRRWLIDYVNNVIKGQQTNTDRLTNNIVNESGLRGLLNTALRPYGRVLSQRPVTKFFQGAGRVQMAGVMGPRPRLLIRNKFQLTQNLALYGMKANVRAFLPPNKELKGLLDESLFLKSYTGLEELPADLAKKVEKLWHTAYQWTATSNARQAMEVAYWDIKELIDNPKYKKYGWKPEHLLKEMEFGASATQYQYNAIGMPGVFRHKSLIPATRLTSWWMNYFAKFHREALHRAFTGRPSWSGPDGPTLPWSRRLGWLRYAVLGGLILNTMGYTRSYMFGAAPTGWPPALQAVNALYRYTIADDDVKRKAAKGRFYNAAKTFIPGYIAYKDFNAVWTGKKDLESLFFYKKR